MQVAIWNRFAVQDDSKSTLCLSPKCTTLQSTESTPPRTEALLRLGRLGALSVLMRFIGLSQIGA